MGFFSKLFGFSDNSENKASSEKENVVSSVPVENKQTDSPFSNFFGVNMLKAPANDWKLTSVYYDSERMMTFTKEIPLDPEAGHVFDCCEALVIGDKFTNFIFEAPYNYNLLAKAVFFIEKNFVDKNTTMLRTTVKYEEELKEYNYDPFLSFDVHDDSFSIQYLRNTANGNMRFIIRTSLCFKELDYDQLEKDHNNSVEADLSSEETLTDSVTKTNEESLSDFFGIDLLKSPTKEWILSDVTYDNGRMMTFEKDIELDPDVYHVFEHCRALVLGNEFTNFIFDAPYNYELLAKAFYFIEKNFVDKTTTMLRTTAKYEAEMKEYNYDSFSFEMNDKNLCIQYMRNNANGNMRFIIRTAYCFHELDYDRLEKVFTEQKSAENSSVSESKEAEDEGFKIYVPAEDGSFKKAPFSGKNMSINNINERLGFQPKFFYTWFTNDYETNICMKVFSQDIICILSNKNLGDSLTQSQVSNIMRKDGYEYDRAFDIYNRESLLEEAISEHFLSQSFMEEATHIKCVGNVLVDPANGYTYIFENGYLKSYTSSDGLIGQAKQMKGTPIFNIVKANAQKIYSNDQDVLREINSQLKAYANIPMDQLEIAAGYAYNYNYSLYYIENCGSDITISDFLEYTHDRAVLLDDSSMIKTYKYQDKKYSFNAAGNRVYVTDTSLSGRKAHLTGSSEEVDLDVVYSKDNNINAICIEVEQEDSSISIAINCCESKTQGSESKYFTMTAIGDTIIARDAYTQEYYFTGHSNALSRILQSGKQYLGSVNDIDISDVSKPIFEIIFIPVGD